MEDQLKGAPINLEDREITFTIDVNSINTNNEDRDNHLKSDDFFDVETYPHITFESTHIVETETNKYDVTGDLTVKGMTKETTFNVTYLGAGTNPWGVEVRGFEGEGEISRKAHGLTWNQALETGGVLVGDAIQIMIELQINPAEQ